MAEQENYKVVGEFFTHEKIHIKPDDFVCMKIEIF
jgi:hypothetical protein